eukprot:scaffold52129_cov58-Phaeocystis_antarctica.AAC.3
MLVALDHHHISSPSPSYSPTALVAASALATHLMLVALDHVALDHVALTITSGGVHRPAGQGGQGAALLPPRHGPAD